MLSHRLHLLLSTATEQLLDTLPTAKRNTATALFVAATTATSHGVIAATESERFRFWTHWQNFLQNTFPMHQPILSNYPLPTRLALLGAFAAFIQAGQHQPANKQVSAQTVLLALRAISQTHMLDGQPDPLADKKGQRHIILKRQIENYCRHDPSPKRKLALPHITIKYLNVTRADNNPRYQAIHDLCTIAWFYLLRVGEYTQTSQSARRRTIQFRLEDVTLWNHTQVLRSTLPLQILLSQCTAATLRISNQKNGRRNQVIHQEATRDVTCPIAARYNITPADISSHSLRAGGAMALHLGGVPAHTIKILGRWSSDTFLLYIQEQITGFSAGLSTQMSSTPLNPNAAIQPTLRLLNS
ncbi:hypothetical protein IV203_012246 [Nitzschia inconspicua]|uniref:Tyr recombinase domain-containing protein n=1 Tax=Nitzschia inconspicua TaxID=303405 RepID=A0A9K3PLR4_9STRA|nr:hypothetical protein IV203_012246 [Nitzschia inconspicua]